MEVKNSSNFSLNTYWYHNKLLYDSHLNYSLTKNMYNISLISIGNKYNYLSEIFKYILYGQLHIAYLIYL